MGKMNGRDKCDFTSLLANITQMLNVHCQRHFTFSLN